MQVPGKMVDAALDEFRGWAPAKKGMERALETALSMARKRLKAQTPHSAEMHEAIDYAFDHAFPGDES